jgi:hypothetical protein
VGAALMAGHHLGSSRADLHELRNKKSVELVNWSLSHVTYRLQNMMLFLDTKYDAIFKTLMTGIGAICLPSRR